MLQFNKNKFLFLLISILITTHLNAQTNNCSNPIYPANNCFWNITPSNFTLQKRTTNYTNSCSYTIGSNDYQAFLRFTVPTNVVTDIQVNYYGNKDIGAWLFEKSTNFGSDCFSGTRIKCGFDYYGFVTLSNCSLSAGKDYFLYLIFWNDGFSQIQVNLTNLSNGCRTALPVDLLFFNVNEDKNCSKIEWGTLSELNNEGFFVQHSNNGMTFQDIDFINGNGNSNSPIKYEYTDCTNEIKGQQNYYRLKQIDFDGKYSYSPIRRLNTNTYYDIAASPYSNLIKLENALEIKFYSEYNTSAQIEILNIEGKPIRSEKIKIAKDYITFTVNTHNWKSGIYIVKITEERGYHQSFKTVFY